MGILVLEVRMEICSDLLLWPALQPLLPLRLIPSTDPMAMEDMALAMLDMADTMAPMLPLLLLVVLPSVAMDNPSLLLTTPPMAMLLQGSMLLTLLALSILPRGLLVLMLTMVPTTLDPRPLVSLPSPMLDSLCRDMLRDMAMGSMVITRTPY